MKIRAGRARLCVNRIFKMKKHILLYIIIFSLFLGCTAPVTAEDTSLFCMDTVMHLRIYADDSSAADALSALLTDLDKTYSVTDPESALFQLNETGSSRDPRLLALLKEAEALCLRTDGRVDPSVYPVVRLWGFTGDHFRVPDEPEILDALSHTGMEQVGLTEDSVTLADGAALDLGAFAKGWAGDLCRAYLEERGLSAILTLGGNIQTVGKKPDGKPWIVGVANPDSPGDYLLTLSLQGSHAVVTSGDYQRWFEQDGVRYCHIFDPETGRPVQNSLRSVTVVCASGVTADGLSTALFVMGFDKAVEFWRQSSDFEAVFIDKAGSVWVTEGLASVVDGGCSVIEREAS